MGEQAKSAASRATAEARHQASDLAQQARDAAYDGAHRVREEAERRAQAGVDRGADEVSHTADALRRAADEAGERTIQGQVLRYAADGLTDISHSIRGKSLGDMAGDLAEFGRRNPVAFLGGAALAGFALSRFVRATRPQPRHDGPRGPYGSPPTPGYGSGYDRGTMRQPTQPATTHTPTGAAGPVRPVGGTLPTGASTGITSGATAGSTGSVGTSTAGTSSGGVPGGAGRSPASSPTSPAGVKPATTGGSTSTGTTSTKKGTPNV